MIETNINNREHYIIISCFIICLLFFVPLLLLNNLDIAFGQTLTTQKYKKVFTTDIPYGSTKNGQKILGAALKNDLPPRGPESFSNDAEGNFYICDTVNRRIQLYSKDGNYQGEISLKQEILPNDITIDDSKDIYIYDNFQGILHQIDKKGTLLNSVNVDKRRWKCRSSMHIVNNGIYITTCDQEEVLMGKIRNGQLEAPTDEDITLSSKKGIVAPSGRRYLVKLIRWEKGEIYLINTDGSVIKSIDLPIKGIVSIKFLKEDKKNNFYVQTERVENEKILLEVQKFDPNVNLLSTVLIPENDYKIWSIKLLSIDDNGHIWQLLPELEKARLNVFQQIDE